MRRALVFSYEFNHLTANFDQRLNLLCCNSLAIVNIPVTSLLVCTFKENGRTRTCCVLFLLHYLVCGNNHHSASLFIPLPTVFKLNKSSFHQRKAIHINILTWFQKKYSLLSIHDRFLLQGVNKLDYLYETEEIQHYFFSLC